MTPRSAALAPISLATPSLDIATRQLKSRKPPVLPSREDSDICNWLEANFYIAAAVQAREAAAREALAISHGEEDEDADFEETNEGRIVLAPHQKCILRLALTRGPEGRLPFNAVVYSSPKKTGKCLAYGEDVLLSDGSWAPVESLADFETVSYSDGRIVLADAHVADNGDQRCITIRTQLGRVHTRTKEHPFLTVDGWRAASTLRPGDKIAVPLRLPEPPPQRDGVTANEAKIMAYMIGDGSVGHGKLSFTQCEGMALSEFMAICAEWGLIVTSWQNHAYGVSAPQRGKPGFNHVRELLRREGILGRTSGTQRVPASIFRSSNEIVSVFLSRLFSCDGWASDQTIGYGSISEGLARDVQRLLLRFGIQSRLARKPCAKCKTGVSCEVTFADRQGVLDFSEAIGIYGKEGAVAKAIAMAESRYQKRARLVDVLHRSVWPRLAKLAKEQEREDYRWLLSPWKHRTWAARRDFIGRAAEDLGDSELADLCRADIGWDEIVSVEDAGIKATVSVSVPGPQTFVTESIEHNSAIAAGVGYWMAETQTVMGDIACVGNDAKQSRERSFRDIRRAIMLTPGYDRARKILPGRWIVQETQLTCISTQSRITPLALDAAGEAGGAAALVLWTEAWGLISKEAQTMYAEMAPAPTLPDSIRWVESYAGFEGESMLLWNLFTQKDSARQLTAHDLAMAGSLNGTCTKPGETYEELLYAFAETEGDPEAEVPIWVNDASALMIYWDEGEVARRMPWLQGEKGRRYYASEAASQTPSTMERIHQNRWVASETSFIPIEAWDACYDPDLPPLDFETPIVVSVDAAVSNDSFGVVAVSRRPGRPMDPSIRARKVWYPPKGGEIDYDEPEAFIRFLTTGGCAMGHPHPLGIPGGMSNPKLDALRAECGACLEGKTVPRHNVLHICFDAFQLHNMMQTIARECDVWVKAFPQQKDRLIADRQLYSVIVTGRLTHNEHPKLGCNGDGLTVLRDHIRNANVKLQKDEDSKMRLIKKADQLKIDLAVAASMGIARALWIIMS